MFKNAKVGDRVWDFCNGWGTITQIDNEVVYPISVDFDNGICLCFNEDGKHSSQDINPRLFWDEIKFEIPEKPFNLEDELRKLEIKDFIVEEFNYNLYWNNKDEKIECNYGYWTENPSVIYFTENSVKKFIEKIGVEKITKEQFFKAYNNVFFNNKKEVVETKEKTFNLKEFLKENLKPIPFKCDDNNYYICFVDNQKEWRWSCNIITDELHVYFGNNENNIKKVIKELSIRNIKPQLVKEAFKELGWYY